MSALPSNLRWTSKDLESMTPEQIRRLTSAGQLKHILAGNELPQEEADALKAEGNKAFAAKNFEEAAYVETNIISKSVLTDDLP